MKQLITAAFFLGISQFALAHDEGHGPKLNDTGKHGGLVSGVVLKADAPKGAKAPLVHKAELARASDGTVRVYLYDTQMNSLDLKGFDAKGSASVQVKIKGKWQSQSFPVELKDGVFIGKMTKPAAKPYNLDVNIKKDDKELLSAFDNLD